MVVLEGAVVMRTEPAALVSVAASRRSLTMSATPVAD
jgi:hypothetical protein